MESEQLARSKSVLIISPYFPPTNAADMQRVRMSLPYFRKFGWEAEVVTVNPVYSDMVTDPLLVQTVPEYITVHYVKAFSKKWTSKIGLGSIALRSLLFYKKRVNALLRRKRYDLIYFSTTQYPVCILGAYWKKKFGIPYVIDVQDPWHTDYYMKRPKSERPPKYWFAYRLGKLTEPMAMSKVDGLISVSAPYLDTLNERYEACRLAPQRTIPFGAFEMDFDVAQANLETQPSVLPLTPGKLPVVYIGRGGRDMHQAVTHLFEAFRTGLTEYPTEFSRLHFNFIGTSYAPAGTGVPSIEPVAKECGVSDYVTEMTDRLPFYQTLNTLKDAPALFIPGSNDAQYTASKIYPYVLAGKPMLALFHRQSSVVSFLAACGAGTVLTFDEPEAEIRNGIKIFLHRLVTGELSAPQPDGSVLQRYSAEAMTELQCGLFDEVLQKQTESVQANANRTSVIGLAGVDRLRKPQTP